MAPLPGLPRSTSRSSNLTLNEKRRSILSIDGALDAMKAKDMWNGLKGVANPPDQQEAARKRGTSPRSLKSHVEYAPDGADAGSC